MVQIINMPKSPSWSESVGEAASEGFTRGMNRALDEQSENRRETMHYRNMELYKQKEEARQLEKSYKLSEMLAKMDGNTEMAPVYYSIAATAGDAAAIKYQKEMNPQDKSRMLEDMDTHAYENEEKTSDQFKNEQNQAPVEEGTQIVLDSRMPKQTQPEAIKQASEANLIDQNNRLPQYDRFFVGRDKKTGEKKYESVPKTLSQVTNLEDARLYAKWNSGTEEGRNKIVSQWLANENRKSMERKAAASEKRANSKDDKKFIEESRKSFDASQIASDSLGKMAEIRKSNKIGALSAVAGVFDPEIRAAKAEYDTHASNILNFYKSLFPRGITQAEFKRITDDWLPASNFTDATNEARERAFGDMISHAIRKRDAILSMQRPDGTYPENLASLVDRQMADETKYLKEKLKEPVVTHKVGESFENLPDARELKGAVIIDEKGNELISDGSSWKLNKK